MPISINNWIGSYNFSGLDAVFPGNDFNICANLVPFDDLIY